jgi:hypothetical protein
MVKVLIRGMQDVLSNPEEASPKEKATTGSHEQWIVRARG